MNKATKITIKAVIITLVSIAIIVFLYLVSQNIGFEHKRTIIVHFDYVGNVNVGTPVRKSGIKIGTVAQLKINPEDQSSVFVTIKLAAGQVARKDDRWTIVSRGLLGDMNIEVFPGPIDSPEVPDEYLFKGLPMFDINRALIESSEFINNVNDASRTLKAIIQDNEAATREIINNIRDVSVDAKAITRIARDTLAALPQIKDSLLASSANLATSIEKLTEKAGELMSGLNKSVDTTAMDIAATLKSVEQASRQLTAILEGLNKKDSVVGRLQDPQVSSDMAKTISNLQALSENLLQTSKTVRAGIEDLMKPKSER